MCTCLIGLFLTVRSGTESQEAVADDDGPPLLVGGMRLHFFALTQVETVSKKRDCR